LIREHNRSLWPPVLCTLSDVQNEPCTHSWQGNLATGAQLRTVSVHMLAMVQMAWRGQSSAYRVLTEFTCWASIRLDLR
jgi:hypothetical protein